MKTRQSLARTLKRFAGLGFLFFLLKGLLWLTVPAVITFLLSNN